MEETIFHVVPIPNGPTIDGRLQGGQVGTNLFGGNIQLGFFPEICIGQGNAQILHAVLKERFPLRHFCVFPLDFCDDFFEKVQRFHNGCRPNELQVTGIVKPPSDIAMESGNPIVIHEGGLIPKGTKPPFVVGESLGPLRLGFESQPRLKEQIEVFLFDGGDYRLFRRLRNGEWRVNRSSSQRCQLRDGMFKGISVGEKPGEFLTEDGNRRKKEDKLTEQRTDVSSAVGCQELIFGGGGTHSGLEKTA
jgi:hypothetical protein